MENEEIPDNRADDEDEDECQFEKSFSEVEGFFSNFAYFSKALP